MSESPRFWAIAVAVPLAAAALLLVPVAGYTGEHGTVLAAERQAVQLDVFAIASSRTVFFTGSSGRQGDNSVACEGGERKHSRRVQVLPRGA